MKKYKYDYGYYGLVFKDLKTKEKFVNLLDNIKNKLKLNKGEIMIKAIEEFYERMKIEK